MGWIQATEFVDSLAQFGLARLPFVAGNEVDFAATSDQTITRASAGWVISLAAGIGAGFVLGPTAAAAVIIGTALCSTALGAELPILHDAGKLKSPTGIAVTALGAAV